MNVTQFIVGKQMTEDTIEKRIERLEKLGVINPDCEYCKITFYPALRNGTKDVFAPAHKASPRCQSGKRPHCTCDTCF